MEKFILLVAFSGEASDMLEETEKETFEEKLQELRENFQEDYDFKLKEFNTAEEMNAYVEGVNDANGWLDDAMFEFKP